MHPPCFNYHILEEIKTVGGSIVYIFRVYSKHSEKEMRCVFIKVKKSVHSLNFA